MLWNHTIAPSVSAAVIKGSGSEHLSGGQQKVANTALYVLMQRAVVSGCPLSGQGLYPMKYCGFLHNLNSRCFLLNYLLPPAYVVRREGYVLTRVCPSVCPQGGGGGQSSWGGGGVSPAGRGVSPARGGVSPARGGSANIGQQNEYSLHGGRYASCVHAGGLSC